MLYFQHDEYEETYPQVEFAPLCNSHPKGQGHVPGLMDYN